MEPQSNVHTPQDIKISRRPKFSWIISIVLVIGLVITGYFILFSKAATTDVATTNSLYGTWVLQQVSSATELNNYKSQITQALDAKGTTGLSVRFPWNKADLSGADSSNALLDASRKMVDDYNTAHPGANKLLSIRFMAGRHTPTRVFDAGAKYYIINGSEKVGIPWGSTSTTTYAPNSVWVTEYDKYVGKLAAWSKSHNVHLLHLSWWAQDWAELNYGAEVRAVAGFSYNNWLAGHKEIIDIGVKYADDSLTVEAPLSGYGPLANGPSAALADYIISKVGQNSSKFYVQANGWNETQEWGAPDLTTENQFRKIWDKPIKRGLQMIQPQDYDWTKVYSRPVAVNASYVEVYLPSFNLARSAQLKTEIANFCTLCSTTTPDSTSPTVAISAPTANATVSGTATITATASDNSGGGGSGLDKIELYIDGALTSSSVTSPLNYSWDTKAVGNGSHVIAVKAYDKASNIGSATNNVTVSNADTTAPTAPTGLTATATDAGQVDLSWAASTDNTAVVGYEVNRDTTSVATGVKTTSYSDTNVTASTTYSYNVVAVDGAGNKSAASASVSVKTPAAVSTAPQVPTGLKASASNQEVKLSWQANNVSNIKQYGIRFRKAGSNYWTFLKTSTSTSYDVTKLPPNNAAPLNGTNYEFSIRARNDSDQTSAWSDTTNEIASAKPMPNAPGNLAITSSITGSGVTSVINWSAAVDSKPGDAYQLSLNGANYTTSSTTYSVAGLKKCTTYTAEVKSIDSRGNTSSPVSKSFTTPGKKFLWWCY